MGADDRWLDRDGGPVVRPYAVTGGRTEPAGGKMLEPVAVVALTHRRAGPDEVAGLSPEHRRIMSLCEHPVTVADVAAATGLPPGVVRVLLADLVQQARISVLPQRRPEDQPGTDVLRGVLHGLRAL